MMKIASNSVHVREGKRGEVKWEYGEIWGEEWNTDYGGMVQPCQQCVKRVGIGHERFENGTVEKKKQLKL